MKLRTLFCGLACGVATLLLTTSVASMNNAGGGDEELRQALRQAGKRTEFHEKLRHIRGKYAHSVKWWRAPGATAIESEGKGTTEWAFDGRFVTQQIKGKWMNLSFEAEIIVGYDNAAERYTAVWMDSLTNRTLFCTGKLDESGETITMHGEYVDVITREPVKVRSVFEVPSRQKKPRIEMYRTNSEGEEFKFLEVSSERWIPPAG